MVKSGTRLNHCTTETEKVKYHLRHPWKWLHLLKSKYSWRRIFGEEGGKGEKGGLGVEKRAVTGTKESQYTYGGLVLTCICEWDGWPTTLLLKAYKWHFSTLWYKKLTSIWKTVIEILPTLNSHRNLWLTLYFAERSNCCWFGKNPSRRERDQ